MQEMQCNRLIGELALDDATAEQFKTVYTNYMEEMGAIRDEMKPEMPENDGEMTEAPAPKPAPTDAEVEAAIKARFTQGRKMIDVSEKYYEEFSKFLSPKQIQKVYDNGRFNRGRGPQGMQPGPGMNKRPRGGERQRGPQPPFPQNEGGQE